MTGTEPAPVVPGLIDPLTAPLPPGVPLSGGVGELIRAVPYAVHPGHRPLLLDLYRPGPTGTGRGAPVVLFLHGGGWRLGDRTVFCPTWRDWRPEPFTRLVAAGFAVASVDYRLSAEARFPAALTDVADAAGWLTTRAAELAVDPDRIVAWGESAGAHLAALLALRPDSRVAGVVDWYGPADLLTGPGARDAGSREGLLLGAAPVEVPDLARAASPLAQARSGAPAFHIAHGTADRLVPVEQSRALAAALRAAGVEVELDLVPQADHLWVGAEDPEAVLDRALAFAARVVAAGR